jgi:RND family efflux transporter MFP subunit
VAKHTPTAAKFRMNRFHLSTLFLLAFGASAAHAQHRTEAFTEPFREVQLSPAEPGILAKLFVEEGAAVKAGEKLASLDTQVLEVSLKIARQAMESKGKLNAAKAEFDLKALRLEKLQALKAKGYSFPEEIERGVADVEVTKANLLSATEQHAVNVLEVEKLEAELELRILRSPINGIVAKINYDEREFVNPPEFVVLTVVQLDPLRIVFPVPTAGAVPLRKNQTVTVRFPETNEEVQGRVEVVSPITDAESGMVRVKVLVSNPDNRHRCGVRAVLSLDPPSSTAAAVKP